MAHATQPETCLDCGAPLSGPYCSQCGQHHPGHDLGMKHMGEEVLHDLWHFDGRLFRTLRFLLFRPGRLTAEYLEGRRTRYVPPFRLYIFISFLLFLFLASGGGDKTRRHSPEEVRRAAQTAAAELESAADTETSEQAKAALRATAARMQAMAKGSGSKPAAAEAGTRPEAGAKPEAGTKPEPGAKAELVFNSNPETDTKAKFVIGTNPDGSERRWVAFERGIERINEDPERFKEELLHWISRIMFILLPAFAALLLVVFMRTRRYFVEHVIFSLHYHAFVFCVFLAQGLLGLIPWAPAGVASGLLMLAPPIYLGVAMKRVYAQPTWKIVYKGALLSAIYLLVAGSALLAVLLYVVSRQGA